MVTQHANFSLFLGILNCAYMCPFTKLPPLMRNTSILTKICLLFSEELIPSSHPHLVKCVVIRINNVWYWRDRWAVVLYTSMWSTCKYILQALIYPVFFFVLGWFVMFLFSWLYTAGHSSYLNGSLALMMVFSLFNNELCQKTLSYHG